jgi:mono/diheme cytochrome c family protein
MEEKYAFEAQKTASALGLIAFIVFLFMLKIALTDAPKLQEEQRFFCGVSSHYSKPIVNEGKMLFINNCASCHSKNMRDALTGPPLIYWKQYLKDEKELLFFLHNPKKYPKKRMNLAFQDMRRIYTSVRCVSFPSLKEADIAALAAYIDGR